MAYKNPVKKNNSSLQVLKTLLCLWDNEYSMSELIEELNKNEKKPVFNNSVVSKYINTCRYCGFEIPRIHSKYFVASTPFKIDLENKELELFKELQDLSKKYLRKSDNKKVEAFLQKLEKLSNKNIINIEKKNIELISEKFEKAILDSKKINLIFRTKEVLECCPWDIIENKGKIFFKVYDGQNERMVPLDKVSGLEITKIRFKNNFSNITVIYKINGNLMKRYSLHENEELLETRNDGLIISCKGEDKDILLSRLLRYDSCCEILSPREYREEIKRIVKDSLANYEEK